MHGKPMNASQRHRNIRTCRVGFEDALTENTCSQSNAALYDTFFKFAIGLHLLMHVCIARQRHTVVAHAVSPALL